ncbi:MAG: radical SAM protein [Deltaproteobacteria bacterium]|nr:MAG: radical SAM protein [Deltaproteobacteria bacterium]
MEQYRPETIFIEKEAQDKELTRVILGNLPGVPVEYIEDPQDALGRVAKAQDPISDGKKLLLITNHPGTFVKKCPGTKIHICCNYYVINAATNCPLECSYCALQGYLENNPLMRVFANTGDMLNEITRFLDANRERSYRLGTGELADSLVLDNITGFTRDIVPFFARQKNAVLELKTKTDLVDNLIGLDHGDRVIVSWSLSPQRVIDEDEAETPSLARRLKAARRCQDAGYQLGFHFDPIIIYPDWEKEYRGVVDQLFAVVDPLRVSWISLGGFRYYPLLKRIIRRRFPRSKILCGEFVPCADGKLRYLKHIRVEAYRKLLDRIKGFCPKIPVYLCMETKEVWERVFGYTPDTERSLDFLFG